MLSLDLGKMKGSYYDRANNMKGELSGLRTRLRKLNSLTLYIRCYAVQDNLSKNIVIKNCIGITEDI